jgi:hypothetical protein
MPIRNRVNLGDLPCLIQGFDHLVGQRTLLQIRQVILQLRSTRHTDDNTIITILNLQGRVVNRPPQGGLDHSQTRLIHSRLDGLQSLECALLEVPVAVHLARLGGVAEPALGGHHVGGLDLAAEEATGDGVVHHDVEAIAPAGWDKLGFDGACYAVVHGLEDGRPHPFVVFAGQDDLGHLKCGEVADAQVDELAGFVELVEGREGFGEGG